MNVAANIHAIGGLLGLLTGKAVAYVTGISMADCTLSGVLVGLLLANVLFRWKYL